MESAIATSAKSFIDENFLLQTDFAVELFHDYAKDLPIIDYHNHLPPNEIAEDKSFDNITKVWLNGDHYKWRAMRANGVNEKFITGNADDKEKFIKWAETVPYTMRNPLYHWTHLELRRYFGISERLSGENAEQLYHKTSTILGDGKHSVLGLLDKMNVEIVCTTDDPCDDLNDHKLHRSKNHSLRMYPAFRPDNAVLIDAQDFTSYLAKLGNVADIEINSIITLQEALRSRIEYFHDNNCRLCDHGLSFIPFMQASSNEVNLILNKVLAGDNITKEETEKYQTYILIFLAREYHKRGWVQQFHLGALRNNNSRMLSTLGPDTGWDSIGDFSQAATMSRFFNTLDSTDQLAQTIIYNLNPADNELFATMIGNFNDGTIAGKMQLGSGWWFLDQLDGMEKQINALSNMGLISRFVGMLTDSRSFLSFPRHEYFRRLICNVFGKDVAAGLLPADMKWIGKIVSDICYHNANNYFKF